MIAGIFMLAAMLVIAAIASIAGAIMLVPTDLGFAYLQASSILIGAGAIVMAVGFAARALDRRLASLTSVPRLRAAEPESPAEAAELEAAELPKVPEASASPAAGAATAAIAAAGATLAATSLLRDRDDETRAAEPTPIPAIAADLPESDPFNDILKDVAEVVPPTEAGLGDVGEGHAMPEPVEVTVPGGLEPLAPEIALPPVDLPLPIDLDAIRVAVDEAVVDVVTSADNLYDHHTEDRSENTPSEDHISTIEITEGAPAGPSSTPGLIPDADMAAIAADNTPPLAPLETLTAVGSYDSGGTRFTMYSDGSVVAQGPEGERRFHSLEELRRHIGGG